MNFVAQALGLGYGELALIDPTRNGMEPVRGKRWSQLGLLSVGRIFSQLVHQRRILAAGPEKLATILCQEIKKLRAMDRYERRARSRRKIAIREFDAARRQTTT